MRYVALDRTTLRYRVFDTDYAMQDIRLSKTQLRRSIVNGTDYSNIYLSKDGNLLNSGGIPVVNYVADGYMFSIACGEVIRIPDGNVGTGIIVGVYRSGEKRFIVCSNSDRLLSDVPFEDYRLITSTARRIALLDNNSGIQKFMESYVNAGSVIYKIDNNRYIIKTYLNESVKTFKKTRKGVFEFLKQGSLLNAEVYGNTIRVYEPLVSIR